MLAFDLGGGTLDLSLIESKARHLKVLRTGGNMHLGGQDFDQRIVDWLVAVSTGILSASWRMHGHHTLQMPPNLSRPVSRVLPCCACSVLSACGAGPGHCASKLRRAPQEVVAEGMMPPPGSQDQQTLMRRLRQEAEILKNELAFEQVRESKRFSIQHGRKSRFCHTCACEVLCRRPPRSPMRSCLVPFVSILRAVWRTAPLCRVAHASTSRHFCSSRTRCTASIVSAPVHRRCRCAWWPCRGTGT